MARSKEDKRSTPRIPWQLPASLNSKRGRSQIDLRDISSRGLFFFTDAKIEKQSKIEIVLMMPAELVPLGQQWVCCQATVVRVEDKPDEKLGVAAVIDRCEALPQI